MNVLEKKNRSLIRFYSFGKCKKAALDGAAFIL